MDPIPRTRAETDAEREKRMLLAKALLMSGANSRQPTPEELAAANLSPGAAFTPGGLGETPRLRGGLGKAWRGLLKLDE
jgi:hypothetical protein